MIPLILGGAALVALMAALGMFSRARVPNLKAMGIWAAALGGLLLAVLLFLTGRGATAIAALVLLGPMVWSWIAPRRTAARPGAPRSSGLSRMEAYEVLGLKPGASEDEIRAAHRRLMTAAHPDHGGSDWLAARINQARDVLLG